MATPQSNPLAISMPGDKEGGRGGGGGSNIVTHVLLGLILLFTMLTACTFVFIAMEVAALKASLPDLGALVSGASSGAALSGASKALSSVSPSSSGDSGGDGGSAGMASAVPGMGVAMQGLGMGTMVLAQRASAKYNLAGELAQGVQSIDIGRGARAVSKLARSIHDAVPQATPAETAKAQLDMETEVLSTIRYGAELVQKLVAPFETMQRVGGPKGEGLLGEPVDQLFEVIEKELNPAGFALLGKACVGLIDNIEKVNWAWKFELDGPVLGAQEVEDRNNGYQPEADLDVNGLIWIFGGGAGHPFCKLGNLPTAAHSRERLQCAIPAQNDYMFGADFWIPFAQIKKYCGMIKQMR